MVLSTSFAFASAPPASSSRAASCCLFSAALINVPSGAALATPATPSPSMHTAIAAATRDLIESDLRQNAGADPVRLNRNARALEQREPQIRERRVLRIVQVLAALDLAVAMTEHRD